MLNYIEEDESDTVIGLSIYVSMCRSTQIRMINTEIKELTEEMTKAKAFIQELTEKLVEAQNEITSLKTTVNRLEQNQRGNRRRRRRSTTSSST